MWWKNWKPPWLDSEKYLQQPWMWPIWHPRVSDPTIEQTKKKALTAVKTCPCGWLCQFCREKTKK